MAEADPVKKPKPAGKMRGVGVVAGKAVLGLALFVAGVAAGGGGAVIAVSQLGGQIAGLPKIGGRNAAPAAAPGPAQSKLDYVEIDNSFTSNLVDTGRYLQLRIAVSTSGGPAVTSALAAHKLAIISAVLAVLGEAGEPDVADRAAKDRLRANIRTAINDVLRKNTGAGGVDEVFFTSLVVQ
jgi:flagellar basal body-associated protein FliL